MSSISSRTCEDEGDFRIILDLLTRIRPPQRLNNYPARADIEEHLARADARASTRLWFDGDRPIAWAYADEFNNLCWEIDERYEEIVGGEVVRWGEDCIRKTSACEESTTLDASCREDDAGRISFLGRHGFDPTPEITLHMTCSLAGPLPEPELPRGFVIRPLAGRQEAEAAARMHRAAFGSEYMTTENRLALMSTSTYDPALDLVAVAPDGAIAANCICSFDETEKTGSTDPVATHPAFQRRGLARALLLAGLALLRERGARLARLGTSGDNAAMQKAARSAGFVVESRTIWFSRRVD